MLLPRLFKKRALWGVAPYWLFFLGDVISTSRVSRRQSDRIRRRWTPHRDHDRYICCCRRLYRPQDRSRSTKHVHWCGDRHKFDWSPSYSRSRRPGWGSGSANIFMPALPPRLLGSEVAWTLPQADVGPEDIAAVTVKPSLWVSPRLVIVGRWSYRRRAVFPAGLRCIQQPVRHRQRSSSHCSLICPLTRPWSGSIPGDRVWNAPELRKCLSIGSAFQASLLRICKGLI